ncbi:DUF397 domain-containing protein [Actinomadura verrucosospora]|uniref:DUF397 domain-containing protein n=1 Tax=Actinomadura verrucosospora TaxID=46165 RepID=UPI001567A40E|nr:DUF397 domain-containing protein [Actinomadura verrucosospora]
MTKPDLSTAKWRKSSHSGHDGGNCIEVANISPVVAVRDSKDPDGPKLAFGASAWRAFAERIKADAHDLP